MNDIQADFLASYETIIAHCLDAMPLEACGVIIAGAFHPVTNQIRERDMFLMDAGEVLALIRERGPVEAVVHSHAYQPAIASEPDLAGCERTGVPWFIVSVPTGKWICVSPSGFMAPLIGRRWAWGSQDCYALVRDAFKAMAGIELTDHIRDVNMYPAIGPWIDEGWQERGFVEIPVEAPWRHLDVAGLKIRSKHVNHVGVWLEGDMLLHHLANQNSARQPFAGTLRQLTTLHLRHKDLIK